MKNVRYRKNILFRPFTYILSLAFAGIIGNRADALFLYLLRKGSIVLPTWAEIVAVVFVAVPLAVLLAVIVSIPLTISMGKLMKSAKTNQSIKELDTSLLKLLENVGSKSVHERAFAVLVDDLLSHTLDVFGNGTEIIVFRTENPQTLYAWCAKGLTNKSLLGKIITITTGQETTRTNNQPNLVRKAYADGRRYLIQKSTDENGSTERGFIKNNNASELAIPIFDTASKYAPEKRPLGVLSISSPRTNAFSETDLEIANSIAERFSALLLLSKDY